MRIAAYLGALALAGASVTSLADGHMKPYSLRGCHVTETTIIDKADGMAIGHNLARGTTTSEPADSGFDKMAYECQSVWNASKAGLSFSARCTFVDRDGDRMLGQATKSDPASSGWDWVYLGGSGKWAGIKGSGKSMDLGKMPELQAGLGSSCWESKGTYSLGN